MSEKSCWYHQSITGRLENKQKELETKMIDEIFNENWLKNSFELLLSFLQYNSNIK